MVQTWTTLLQLADTLLQCPQQIHWAGQVAMYDLATAAPSILPNPAVALQCFASMVIPVTEQDQT